ncbi:MAG: TraR/DksA C4-type zinc finger protein [Longimicrobiaceae bacterium]
MTQEQRTHLEGRLREERERVERSLARLRGESARSQLEQDGDLSAYPLHPADEGTDTLDQEMEFAEASRQSRLLAEIDDALALLVERPEEYGRCRDCDGEIPFERLELVPWARDCDCSGEIPTPA